MMDGGRLYDVFASPPAPQQGGRRKTAIGLPSPQCVCEYICVCICM